MNAYFLDTNALVKRYHQEMGSDVIDRLFTEAEATFIISDISIIEFFSAISLKVRTSELDDKGFSSLKTLFAQDIKDGVYKVVRFTGKEKIEATKLLLKYGKQHSLKTLDAIQLSLMKSIDWCQLTSVVCADDKFANIIRLEGFHLVNPVKTDVI